MKNSGFDGDHDSEDDTSTSAQLSPDEEAEAHLKKWPEAKVRTANGARVV